MAEENISQDQKLVENPVLLNAWTRFAEYDIYAGKQQKRFIYLRITILSLGVLAIFVALSYSYWGPGDIDPTTWYEKLWRYVVILLPISTSVLLAGAVKFDAGTKWILLRNSAEAIKKEIYRYRANAEIYSKQNEARTGETRETKLARKIKTITNRVMKTQVNLSHITLSEEQLKTVPSDFTYVEGDDCFSNLSSEEYIRYRLQDQCAFYKNRTGKLERELKLWQWSIYFLGGLGTFLAAIGQEIWIAVSSGISGAFITYLEFKRTEQTLISYNQAATDLQGIHAWWFALKEEDRNKSINHDKLVKNTEAVIQSEHFGWVQEMKDALEELYGKDNQESTSDSELSE
jgi:hypothetical protein